MSAATAAPIEGRMLDCDGHLYMEPDVMAEIVGAAGASWIIDYLRRFVGSEQDQELRARARDDVWGVKGISAHANEARVCIASSLFMRSPKRNRVADTLGTSHTGLLAHVTHKHRKEFRNRKASRLLLRVLSGGRGCVSALRGHRARAKPPHHARRDSTGELDGVSARSPRSPSAMPSRFIRRYRFGRSVCSRRAASAMFPAATERARVIRTRS